MLLVTSFIFDTFVSFLKKCAVYKMIENVIFAIPVSYSCLSFTNALFCPFCLLYIFIHLRVNNKMWKFSEAGL